MSVSSRLIVAAAMLVSATAFAQSSASATVTAGATARIYKPIKLTKTSDLSFGDIFADSATAGTVLLNPVTNTCTATAPVQTASTGTVSAAAFNVNGKRGATYAISLPADGLVNLTCGTGGAPMPVNAFTSVVAGGTAAAHATTGTLSASGIQSFSVGATLSVGANQQDGDYSGNFNVTVAYN